MFFFPILLPLFACGYVIMCLHECILLYFVLSMAVLLHEFMCPFVTRHQM